VHAWTAPENIGSYTNEASFDLFEDALEGVAGLMRRLGQLRPHLGRLTSGGSSEAGGDVEMQAQRLHDRFAGLLESMRAVSNAGTSTVFTAAKENGLLAFHKDLALFVGNVEVELGAATQGHQQTGAPRVAGERAAGNFASRSLGGFSSLATPSHLAFGGVTVETTSTTSRQPRSPRKTTTTTTSTAELTQRLDSAMFKIVRGVKKLKVLRSQLRGNEPGVVNSISARSKQLDAALLALQMRGSELEGDGSKPTSASEGARYAAELEGFVQVQADFLRELEAMT